MKIRCIIFAAVTAALGQADINPAVAQTLPDIGGPWACSGNCTCVGKLPRDASIAQSDAYVLLRNQCGDVSPGRLTGDTIDAQKWKTTAVVSKDQKQITWPSGVRWLRP